MVTPDTPIQFSSNWAGYVVRPPASGISAISATWNIPRVTCAPSENSDSSQWVGLNGFSSQTLEQDGTDSRCLSGVPTYTSWYELLGIQEINGGSSVTITDSQRPTHANDLVHATVGVISQGGLSQWRFSLENLTAGWSYSISFLMPQVVTGTVTSAEWITERPSVCAITCQVEPLADFSMSKFDNAIVSTPSGPSEIRCLAAIQVVMMTSYGKMLATVSPPDFYGTSFQTTWVNDQ